MNPTQLFHRADDYCKGYLIAGVLVLLEIAIVYVLSNIPFILTTLENDSPEGFISSYVQVLGDEIHKGQLLAFVCALIAPVVFWSFSEYRKAIMTKILSLSALFLLLITAYLHGKGHGFTNLTSFGLYKTALVVWIVSIISNRIPPDGEAYFKNEAGQENGFVKLTRKD